MQRLIRLTSTPCVLLESRTAGIINVLDKLVVELAPRLYTVESPERFRRHRPYRAGDRKRGSLRKGIQPYRRSRLRRIAAATAGSTPAAVEK